jgi:multidrug transporter EmrE-like cation transporter
MVAFFLSTFWAMQVAAAVLIKWGSTAPERWWYGFIIGNLFGAPSLLLAMKVYQRMNPNLALALAMGGSFLFAQLAMAWLFHSRPTSLQWVGLAVIGAGMVLAAGAGAKAGA